MTKCYYCLNKKAQVESVRIPVSRKNSRKDAYGKVTGKPTFTDDLQVGEALYGYIVGSPVAKGKLKKVIFDEEINWEEYVICTYDDISGEKHIPSLGYDEPILVESNIEYHGQPIVLLAHTDLKTLKKAAKKISFEIEEDKPIIDLDDSAHDVLFHRTLTRGDVNAAFEECTFVLEDEYQTQTQEHLYLEPQIIFAEYSSSNRTLHIQGPMQAPFTMKDPVGIIFKKFVDSVVVSPLTAGGAFGGREDYTVQLGIYASLLAIKSNRKIKLRLDRQYDMRQSSKRHPSKTKVKAGFIDNKLHALKIGYTLDGGAYKTISDAVLSRGMLHAGGYRVENILVEGKALKTNKPPNGAFRGFGGPQMFFAVESHIDQCLNTLGIDKVAFYNENLFEGYDKTISGQILSPTFGLKDTFSTLIDNYGYTGLLSEIESYNSSNQQFRKGLGIANIYHGTGYTGYQDIEGTISIQLKLHKNGSIQVQSSAAEFGQGVSTILPQIVSEVLSIPLDIVSISNINTDLTPDSGATSASRATAILGKLAHSVSSKLKKDLNSYTGFDEYMNAVQDLLQENNEIILSESYERSQNLYFDYATLQGDAYESYSLGTLMVVIQTNLLTGETIVERVDAVIDAGLIINQSLAEGQVQGAIMQGIGLALYEDLKYTEKGYINNNLSTYEIPTILETPEVNVQFIEDASYKINFAPRGIGELALAGIAPAVANAIENGIGYRLKRLPITPERLLHVMQDIN